MIYWLKTMTYSEVFSISKMIQNHCQEKLLDLFSNLIFDLGYILLESFFHILIYLFFFRYIGKNLTLSLVIVLTNILILDFFNTGYVLDCFHHWEVATFSTQMHGKKWFLGTPKQILRWKLLPNRWHIGEVTPLLC